MAERVSARLTAAAKGRKFGLTVGTAFLVLAGIAMWRGRTRVSMVLGILGGLLVLAALVVPTYLGSVERAWMGIAHLISKVTTPLFMGVIYFGLMTPIGVLRRTFGRNHLVNRSVSGSFWVDRPAAARKGDLERQF